MGENPPSTFSNIQEIYGESKATSDRFDSIKKAFLQKYGEEPQFYCRAPGRVNIIGEHIDYCGYGVLPMAIEQDIVFAVCKNDTPKYKMSNMNSRFKYYETDVNDFTINGNEWHDYLLCGHKGLLELVNIESPCGLNVMVDGTVPTSAGLSSSSALVCCSALVTMTANGKSFSKLALADVCQKCEKYVGLEGGGMDQAISYLAEKGTAKKIDFNPLKATDVTLPSGVTFVIANSLREMNKSENAGEYYNKRVSECRIAAQILSKKNGCEWRKTRRLVDTQILLNKTLPEMLGTVEKLLHKEPFTREEICNELEITDEELIKECLNPTTAQVKEFKLYQRAKHVYSESYRVLRFKEVCESNAENAIQKKHFKQFHQLQCCEKYCLKFGAFSEETKEVKVKELGDLMNESQESCAKDYECSCLELDELTNICREAGALGSRLTGAGWGGCTVSLVPSPKIPEFLATVKEKYFDPVKSRSEKVDEALFATKPGMGAAVIRLI